MRTSIYDEYLMIYIMNNLLNANDSLIEKLEDRLDNTMDPLTMSVQRDKLSGKYEKIRKVKWFNVDLSDES